ncbi:hypothetical protein L6164_032282 [Bauhinia variegata]|uniref:Uncharacterized protein n=1 Tax=Bauhinia variegata TaxID=167791 RepID=A0ACB9KN61_BAUVA|nr:hypothetical protein L6164_032282 [Bauhinia variegata]
MRSGLKEVESMDSQGQTSSLQRLQNVEKRIVKVLELAGGVVDELASPTVPRKDVVQNQSRIHAINRGHPSGFAITNEICFKKLELVLSQLDGMKQSTDECHAAV